MELLDREGSAARGGVSDVVSGVDVVCLCADEMDETGVPGAAVLVTAVFLAVCPRQQVWSGTCKRVLALVSPEVAWLSWCLQVGLGRAGRGHLQVCSVQVTV